MLADLLNGYEGFSLAYIFKVCISFKYMKLIT